MTAIAMLRDSLVIYFAYSDFSNGKLIEEFALFNLDSTTFHCPRRGDKIEFMKDDIWYSGKVIDIIWRYHPVANNKNDYRHHCKIYFGN